METAVPSTDWYSPTRRHDVTFQPTIKNKKLKKNNPPITQNREKKAGGGGFTTVLLGSLPAGHGNETHWKQL